MSKAVSEYCNAQLAIPNLVGEDCPYSTISNFLIQFYTKSELDLKELKLKSASYQSRIDEAE